ncbi:hydantoinase/oxoprolinase family protein [Bailinhaonella thermotolerans]|uniref:Hydantoinase/oxoprolinase family protein n=1 Tax=Bailinhaonella thermotolerans TaxID=1070861 RepID=A0A3A4BAT2_9ACTN|nr:hydantoinase/oxoprolinase family protein [Bailinhaonella thermotolerans]RJL31308.1 hydantoinase/oxoprolinase family protein [Bailinhaonella thermotolerans]
MIRVGVDTGGTFTDVVAFDEGTGEVRVTKTPSTPEDPAVAFLAGLRWAGGEAGEVGAVCHGTTVATNRLLEGRVGGLGFVTTEGFEFLLEIGRQSVPDGYGNSYFWVKPERIVPVRLVRGVGGRLDHRGREVRPFDDEGAVRVAREFRELGVGAVGVCFLHSYADPAHEERMREVLARECPGVAVSISSEVLREYREYERAVTTLVDAAVKPHMSRYIGRIAAELDRPLHVMKSNGGMLSAREVARQPITTVLSGPAAGALGAALIARTAGYDSVITLDGGGTSTDVAIVQDGEPAITTEGGVGRYPCKIPMIDIVTVGAGGGSVAWISPEGTLKVGPRSAGADPGPMCYRRGGAEPTVTDAHVMLGGVPPRLLGGGIPLDPDAAREGIEALAGGLGLAPERAATGVLEINAWNQANAIRQVTVRRGLDVRDFPMVVFGGSGPLAACRLIDILGPPAVLVPASPGTVSAFGLLTVDVKNDYVRTYVTDDLDPARAEAILAELEALAAGALGREGFPRERHVYLREADLRYHGQAYEVRVPAPAGPVDARWRETVTARFHEAHERLYGYGYRDDPRHRVEWVNLRVSGVGPISRPRLRRPPRREGPPAAPAVRRAFFAGGWVDTPVHRRADLGPGDVVRGPAIVEEFGSTLPVHPGFRARVDDHANLVVTRD